MVPQALYLELRKKTEEFYEIDYRIVVAGCTYYPRKSTYPDQTVKIATTTVAQIGNLRVCLNFWHTRLFLRPV